MSAFPRYGRTFQPFPGAAYDAWKTQEPECHEHKECDTCGRTIDINGPDYCEDCDFDECPQCGAEIERARSNREERISDLCDECETKEGSNELHL